MLLLQYVARRGGPLGQMAGETYVFLEKVQHKSVQKI